MNLIKKIGFEAIVAGAAGGLMFCVAPPQARQGIFVQSLIAAPCIILIGQWSRQIAKLSEDLKIQKAELEKQKKFLDEAEKNLNRRSAEAELREAALRSQLVEMESDRRKSDFELREQAAEVERELQEKSIQLQSDRDRLEADKLSLQAAIRKWHEVEKEIEKLEMRSQLESERQSQLAVWIKQKQDMEAEALANIRRLEGEYLERVKQLEREKNQFEIEVSRREEEHVGQMQAEYRAMQEEIEAQRSQMQDEVFEQAAAQFAAQKESWIVQIDKANGIIRQLKAEVISLHEQLAQHRIPKKPEGLSEVHCIARSIQDWFISKGVIWDFISIQRSREDDCWTIVCRPWWDMVELKKFAGLAKISMGELGLQEPFQYFDDTEGFKLVFKPLESPRRESRSYIKQMAAALQKGANFEQFDEEDPNLPSLTEDKILQTRIESKNYFIQFASTAFTQAHYPLYGSVSPAEEDTIRFWMQYQKICFGKPNLGDKQAIAKIYGVILKPYETPSVEYEAALKRLKDIKRSLHID